MTVDLARWIPELRERREYYSSNMFITVEPDFEKFRCFRIKLNVSEIDAKKTLKHLNVKIPVTIAQNAAFFLDDNIPDTFSFVDKESAEKITISNTTGINAKIIGNLLYQLFDLYFKEIDVIYLIGKNKKIHYAEDNSLFTLIKEDREREAKYIAFRGLKLKMEAGRIPGKIIVFFIPDGSYDIQTGNFDKWIGMHVRVNFKECKEIEGIEEEITRNTIIKGTKNNEVIIKDAIRNKEYLIPDKCIKINANSMNLSKLGVYNKFLRFTSFQDIGEFNFLEKAFDCFNIGEHFNLEYGNLKIKFNRAKFLK